MNLRELNYLVALNNFKHFGKAAEACFVSQPTLSMQIKKLEDELGVLLIERAAKTTRITKVGEILAEKANAILMQVDEMKKIAKLSQNPYAGEMYIGVIPTLGPYLLPSVTSKLKKAFPELIFYFVEDKTENLIEKLKSGKLDMAIMALPVDDKDLKSQYLFDEEFLLAVSKNHALAKYKKLKLSDISRQPLFLLEDGHCLRDQALDYCYRLKHVNMQDFRATSLETLRYMILAGEGVTFMPKLACKKEPGMVYIPFESPKPHRKIGFVFRKGYSREKLVEEIKDVCNSANL